MRMRTRGRHRMVTETSKTTNFDPVSFIKHVFILVSKPTHQYNFFVLASFFRRVKETNETTNLEVRFFYNSSLH